MTMTDTPRTTNLLESDFYFFQDQLSDRENERILELREYFETEVRPIANEYWARAEMPFQLVPGLAALGVFGPDWEESGHFPNSAVFRGWSGMEMARVDASLTTFCGVQGGLAMGAFGVGGSDEQRAYWLPKLASAEIMGAFALTEPLSGSTPPAVSRRPRSASATPGRSTARSAGSETRPSRTSSSCGHAMSLTTRSRASSCAPTPPASPRPRSRTSRAFASCRTPISPSRT
jgi:hypothetical protein